VLGLAAAARALLDPDLAVSRMTEYLIGAWPGWTAGA
jgi:hypothetical protein